MKRKHSSIDLSPIIVGLNLINYNYFNASVLHNNLVYAARSGAYIELYSTETCNHSLNEVWNRREKNIGTPECFAVVLDTNKVYSRKLFEFFGDLCNVSVRKPHPYYEGLNIEYEAILITMGIDEDVLFTNVQIVNIPAFIDVDRAGDPIVPQCVKLEIVKQFGNIEQDGIIIESRVYAGNVTPEDIIKELEG